MSPETRIYLDLRDGEISLKDAIVLLMAARYTAAEAENMAYDWQYAIDMLKDDDEERADGWAHGSRFSGL